MNLNFMIGVMGASLILLQLELALIAGVLTLAHRFPQTSILFNTVAIIISLIFLVGHIQGLMKSNINIVKKGKEVKAQVEENSDKIYKVEGEETVGDVFYKTIFKDIYIFGHGFIWRLKNEWHYIKNIASLKFKSDN